MIPEEELAKKIDESSQRFEEWKKTSDKIPLSEFKEAIKMWRKDTEASTDLLGQEIPVGADKIAYNLTASRNAFSSVLLWGASLELYANRLEKELAKTRGQVKTKKSRARKN